MAERKTRATKVSVTDFIKSVENDTRRKDAKVVAKMMREVSGERARMWGPSIIGYGLSYYFLANGKEESICKIGFSPPQECFDFLSRSLPRQTCAHEKTWQASN